MKTRGSTKVKAKEFFTSNFFHQIRKWWSLYSSCITSIMFWFFISKFSEAPLASDNLSFTSILWFVMSVNLWKGADKEMILLRHLLYVGIVLKLSIHGLCASNKLVYDKFKYLMVYALWLTFRKNNDILENKLFFLLF